MFHEAFSYILFNHFIAAILIFIVWKMIIKMMKMVIIKTHIIPYQEQPLAVLTTLAVVRHTWRNPDETRASSFWPCVSCPVLIHAPVIGAIHKL